MKVAYIGATMDLPHYGHQRLINRTRKIAGIVVVSLNTDEFVERFKGKKPIMSLDERMETVWGFKNVDLVIINRGDEDSKPAIMDIKPDYIVYGDDYTEERYKNQIGVTTAWLKQNNIKLVRLPRTEGISTTEIKKRICESQ